MMLAEPNEPPGAIVNCPKCGDPWNKMMDDGICWNCSPLKNVPSAKRVEVLKNWRKSKDEEVDVKVLATGESER
jgi:hypothetical protein